MKKVLFLALVLALMVLADSAGAATATGSLQVSANVPARCRIKSVTDIAFGNYDPTEETTPLDADGDFVFKCTKGTTYDMYITGTRQMTGATSSDTLSYELYSDSGRTSVWASGSPGITGTAVSNADDTRGVYGRIPVNQDVSLDTYSGSVTITIDY